MEQEPLSCSMRNKALFQFEMISLFQLAEKNIMFTFYMHQHFKICDSSSQE